MGKKVKGQEIVIKVMRSKIEEEEEEEEERIEAIK